MNKTDIDMLLWRIENTDRISVQMTELATKYHRLNDDLIANINSLNFTIEEQDKHIRRLLARIEELEAKVSR